MIRVRIRAEQIAVFESADSTHFMLRIFQHVREAFPKHSSLLGEPGIREVVRYGIEQSRAFGLSRQSPVSLFIDLTLLLGRSFHADPQMPWAGDILSDTSLPDELTRAQRLHAAATRYLDIVSGPENEFIDAAQRRCMYEPAHAQTGSGSGFVREVSVRLERIWPEKYRQMDEESRLALIQGGAAKARAYGSDSETGTLVCTALMYMLGSGFDEDPLFSWAHRVLVDAAGQDPAVRIEALHSSALAYLEQWCG